MVAHTLLLLQLREWNLIHHPLNLGWLFVSSFLSRDLPGGSDGKVSVYNAGDPGSIPGSGRSPGEGNGNPLQYSCLERSLVGYSPWGRKESDMTE